MRPPRPFHRRSIPRIWLRAFATMRRRRAVEYAGRPTGELHPRFSLRQAIGTANRAVRFYAARGWQPGTSITP